MSTDARGEVAVCAECGVISSPFWTARKSAALHREGTKHEVRVVVPGREEPKK